MRLVKEPDLGDIDMSTAVIKVHDISQEYWLVHRTPCSCGGRLAMHAQMLQDSDGTPIDRVVARCGSCGSTRDFLFDISAFHRCITDMMDLAELTSSVSDTQLRKKILMAAAGSPVATAVLAIVAAGEANDRLALEWLSDTIEHAKTKLRPA
jgi:hypothetical protein